MPEQTDTAVEAQELLVSTEATYRAIQIMAGRIKSAKVIDKATARDIQVLTTGMESMDIHFSKHPLNSYTVAPTANNLKVTCEGLLATAAKKLWDIAKSIWKMIVDALKWLYNAVGGNSAKFKTVRETAMKMHKRNSKQADASFPFSPRQTVEVKKLNSSHFALWLGWGESFLDNKKPMQYCYDLFKVEEALVGEVSARMDKLSAAVDADSLNTETVNTLLAEPYMVSDALHRLIPGVSSTGTTSSNMLYNAVTASVDYLCAYEAPANAGKQQPIESRAALYDWMDGVGRIKGFLSVCSLVSGNEYKRIMKIVDYTRDKIFSELARAVDDEGNDTVIAEREDLIRISDDIRNQVEALRQMTRLVTHYYQHSSVAMSAMVTDWGFGLIDQITEAHSQAYNSRTRY
jgi:hypothetical protein